MKANALEGKQKVGFPTNTEEQEIENAKEQQSTNNGCRLHAGEAVHGEAHSTDGALFYHARIGDCHGLDCPPCDQLLDVMQSHPLHKTYFSQYRASSTAV